MGEVYRARDTKLDREVAIKILHDQFADDPERLARFEREVKTLAALNHPNIAQIYGLEGRERPEGGERALALVMELVDGPTLAELIANRASDAGLQASGLPLANSAHPLFEKPQPQQKRARLSTVSWDFTHVLPETSVTLHVPGA